MKHFVGALQNQFDKHPGSYKYQDPRYTMCFIKDCDLQPTKFTFCVRYNSMIVRTVTDLQLTCCIVWMPMNIFWNEYCFPMKQHFMCLEWSINITFDFGAPNNYMPYVNSNGAVKRWTCGADCFTIASLDLFFSLGKDCDLKYLLRYAWDLCIPTTARPSTKCPFHWALTVRESLNNSFPQRWIGRDGPIAWPPRSPDLTPLDFFFWG